MVCHFLWTYFEKDNARILFKIESTWSKMEKNGEKWRQSLTKIEKNVVSGPFRQQVAPRSAPGTFPGEPVPPQGYHFGRKCRRKGGSLGPTCGPKWLQNPAFEVRWALWPSKNGFSERFLKKHVNKWKMHAKSNKKQLFFWHPNHWNICRNLDLENLDFCYTSAVKTWFYRFEEFRECIKNQWKIDAESMVRKVDKSMLKWLPKSSKIGPKMIPEVTFGHWLCDFCSFGAVPKILFFWYLSGGSKNQKSWPKMRPRGLNGSLEGARRYGSAGLGPQGGPARDWFKAKRQVANG